MEHEIQPYPQNFLLGFGLVEIGFESHRLSVVL